MRSNITLQFHTPLENDYQSGVVISLQDSYRLWFFESRPCSVVGFWYGRMLHSDRNTKLSRFRPVGLTRWLKSHWRQTICVIELVGSWSITDGVPSVQPKSGFSVEPLITHKIDSSHAKQRVHIRCGTSVNCASLRLTPPWTYIYSSRGKLPPKPNW